MLRCNVYTEDGLVNCAMGVITGFEWPGGHRTEGQPPCGMQVVRDDCKVGKKSRNSAEHFLTTSVQSLGLQE